MAREVFPESEEEIAREVDEEYPADDPITNKSSISLETFVLLILVGALVAVAISILSMPTQPSSQSIANNSTIFVYVNGNSTKLTPGTAAYNQAVSSLNSAGNEGDNTTKGAAALLALLMFVGFFVSRRSVMRSEEKTWLAYVFIITSVLGWGALGGAISLILGVGLYGGIGGLGGAYYAFWKLQDKGFM